jgi:hypothetical protein
MVWTSAGVTVAGLGLGFYLKQAGKGLGGDKANK